jgi:hypothetical protein
MQQKELLLKQKKAENISIHDKSLIYVYISSKDVLIYTVENKDIHLQIMYNQSKEGNLGILLIILQLSIACVVSLHCIPDYIYIWISSLSDYICAIIMP